MSDRLRNFKASKTPDTGAGKSSHSLDQEVCFSVQVALRGEVGQRMHQNLCDNIVLKLLKSRIRPERNQRSGMAKLVERTQPCLYSLEMSPVLCNHCLLEGSNYIMPANMPCRLLSLGTQVSPGGTLTWAV